MKVNLRNQTIYMNKMKFIFTFRLGSEEFVAPNSATSTAHQ